MADVSIDLLDYFNTWDVLVQIGDVGDVDSFHVEATTRDLLEVSGDHHNTNQKDLHTYDTPDTQLNDLDATHQHWDDGLEERHPRRKSKPDTEEAIARKKLKLAGPWSKKYTYIFLLIWNFIMLAMYSVNNFLYVPPNVWYIVVLFHVSAISLYVYDTACYLLLGKGACKPSPVHII